MRRLRPCLEPRCPVLVESGRCEQHQTGKSWTKRAEPPQLQVAQRLTGRANQRRREALFLREPLCRECAKHGRTTIATIRDHVIPLAEGGTETVDNEQPLCNDCHATKTAEESARGVKRAFGGSTAPIIREVITGAPGRGKTTYVERHRKPGVIVWDLDEIAGTVAQMPTYPRPTAVSSACYAMRQALVDHLHANTQQPFLLIVTDRTDAERLALKLSARLVSL